MFVIIEIKMYKSIIIEIETTIQSFKTHTDIIEIAKNMNTYLNSFPLHLNDLNFNAINLTGNSKRTDKNTISIINPTGPIKSLKV